MPPSATPDQLNAMVTDSGAPLLFLDAANAETGNQWVTAAAATSSSNGRSGNC
jgi:hypothetical protein